MEAIFSQEGVLHASTGVQKPYENTALEGESYEEEEEERQEDCERNSLTISRWALIGVGGQYIHNQQVQCWLHTAAAMTIEAIARSHDYLHQVM